MIKQFLLAIFLFTSLVSAGQLKKNCLYVNNTLHSFLLQDLTGTNARKTLRDTFYIYNACADTVRIVNLRSEHGSFFRISRVLPPRQETPLFFERTIFNKGEEFRYEAFSVHLELEDKSDLALHVQVPVAGNNSKVFFKANGRVDHFITQRYGTRYNMAILTHPDGHIRAKGLVEDGDTAKKVGRWEHYATGKWQLDEVQYSKELTLAALNEKTDAQLYDGNHFPFTIKIREGGVWKQPTTEWSKAGLRFFYTAATDSAVAYTDSSSWGFPLSYAQMAPSTPLQFYLLKPNEPVIKVGMYTTPFATLKDVYVLIPNQSLLMGHRDDEFFQDSLFNALQKKYPKLALAFVGSQQRGIGIGSLTPAEKKQLLGYLEKSDAITYICQGFMLTDRQAQVFCNNQVYVSLKKYQPEEFKQVANDLGFVSIQPDGYTSINFYITYKSKIVDEAFFEAFKKLTEHPVVNYAHFTTYSRPQPDQNPG